MFKINSEKIGGCQSKTIKTKRVCSLFSLLFSVFLFGSLVHAENVVNVYSLRQSFLIEPMLNLFERKTGTTVNVVYADKGIAQRLKSEGKNSPADVILTVDIASLYELVKLDLAQSVSSKVLRDTIPENLRSSDDMWFALTTRARVFYVSKERVMPEEILNYEELSDKKWQGRICVRSGYHKYNVSLFSAFLDEHGKVATTRWLKGFKKNLARKPQGNDRAQAKAIRDGICDVALGNSYYFGQMLDNETEPEQKKWAEAVRLVFPNQESWGTHVNVSGMAMAKHSPNKQRARELMEFLIGEEAQKLYANDNYEYPVNPKVKKSGKISELNKDFIADDRSLEKIAKMHRLIVVLLDRVKFDK